MHKTITNVAIILLALSSLTCTKDFVFDNPLDPNAAIDTPTDLQVLGITETGVTLSWNFMPKYPEYYIQYIETGNDILNFTVIDTVDAGTQVRDINRTFYPDQGYFFRIRANVRGERNSYSNVASKSYGFPTPTNLVITDFSEVSASLSWDFTTQHPELYKQYIEVSTDNNNFSILDSVDATVKSKTLNKTFYADTVYYFRIRVQNGEGRVSSSSTLSKTLDFPSPSNLQIISMTTTDVTLQWTNTNFYATSIDIEQSEDGANYTVVKNVSANNTTTTVTGTFNEATTYYFRATAKSQYNISQPSNTPSYNIAAAGIILVEGGTFTMGSPDGVGDSDEHPQHSVTLSDFYIGRIEVTQKRWREVVQWKQGGAATPLNPNPSYAAGDSLPVERVSWDDIQTWLGYLNEREGITDNAKKYRLPTEAEWEYAARGGKNWQDNYIYSGSNNVGDAAWYSSNSSGTHTVGTKQPNQLGIYDMSGNVWEWCSDWYGNYSSSAQTNPTGPASGSYRILRGGSFNVNDNVCRVAYRGYNNSKDRLVSIGFRVSRSK